MAKDYRPVTFPVMLDMAPYASLTKNRYPYQLAAGISHSAITKTIKPFHDVPQNIRPTDPIE
jgi:hypothetical protein